MQNADEAANIKQQKEKKPKITKPVTSKKDEEEVWHPFGKPGAATNTYSFPKSVQDKK